MAPHSRTLVWKIPWTEEPGRLQSMGSLRVGYDWATSLSLFTFMHWRRKWQPTPVFLPGDSQGRGSLVGCHLWGRRVGHGWSDLAVAVAVGSCCIAQGAQLCALWWRRWVGLTGWKGGPKGKGYMYTYSWFSLLYCIKRHNIVKQLYPIKNKNKT